MWSFSILDRTDVAVIQFTFWKIDYLTGSLEVRSVAFVLQRFVEMRSVLGRTLGNTDVRK